MTREEAIKWLNVERELIVEIPQDNSKELKEAYDIAIKALEKEPVLDTRQRERQLEMEYQHGYDKGWEEGRKALEQQPCEDCISRTELLARIDAERKHLLDIKMDGAEHIIVHHARRIIEDMPSVTPKTSWIPCSERLPEDHDWYVIVVKEKSTGYQYIPRIACHNHDNCWSIIDTEEADKEWLDDLKCIAWLPLPDPYKAESEGDE